MRLHPREGEQRQFGISDTSRGGSTPVSQDQSISNGTADAIALLRDGRAAFEWKAFATSDESHGFNPLVYDAPLFGPFVRKGMSHRA